MIKVFHIISHIDIGGAEKVAFNIASSRDKDVEQHILEVAKGESSYSGMFKSDMDNNKIKYHCSPIKNNKLAILLFPFWFFFKVLKYRPNVIHTHTEVPDLAIYLFHILFGWAFKFKYIRTIHNTQLWNGWGKVGIYVERFFQKHKSNIAISISTQDSYKKEYGEACPIIYNGMPIVAQQEFRDIIDGKINVLFAGRLEYQKGIDQLIETIVRLSKNDRIHFYIIGDGSLKEKLISGLSTCNNFSYYDKIYNLASYLSSFDFLFMPSNFEGLALMPIEAGLAKLPCIVNDCPGLGETMPPGWTLMVKNNNVDDFIEIFNNIEKFDREALKESIHNNASEKFSIQTMQQEYIKIYKHGI